MKLPSSLLILSLLATGCASLAGAPSVLAQAPAPATPKAPAAPAATSPATPPAADALAGKATYEGLCSGCHELSLVEAQGRTKAEWDETTRRMLERGLVATDEQIDAVVNYLAKTHPPMP